MWLIQQFIYEERALDLELGDMTNTKQNKKPTKFTKSQLICFMSAFKVPIISKFLWGQMCLENSTPPQKKCLKVNNKVEKILKIQDLIVLFLAPSLTYEAVLGQFEKF